MAGGDREDLAGAELRSAAGAGPYDGFVPADCFRHEALGVVFQVRDKRLAVLLWRRAEAPFEGAWMLPGGAARRGRAARRVREQAPRRQGRHPRDRAP